MGFITIFHHHLVNMCFFQPPQENLSLKVGSKNSTYYRDEVTPVKPIYVRPFIGLTMIISFITSRGPCRVGGVLVLEVSRLRLLVVFQKGED